MTQQLKEPTWESPADRYRLKQTMAYSDPLIPEPTYHDIAASNTLVVNGPVDMATKKKRHPIAEIVLIVIAAIAMVVVIGYIAFNVGVTNSLTATFFALLPMLLVVGVMSWIDRWEPEPKWVLILAFLWGAGVATSISIIANMTSATWLSSIVSFGDAPDQAVATFSAPIVEETMKGLGVLIIMISNRRRINSPLDGVVISGILAAGFAFTENVLYFAQFSDAIVVVFIMRAIMSPFAHTLFTSMIGLALGLAMTRARHRLAWVWMLPVGWLTAVGLHGLWNGLSSYGTVNFMVVYAIFWLPLFIMWLGITIAVSIKQRHWIITGLQAYVKTGWIHPLEATMLASLFRRRLAMREAGHHGRQAKKAMEKFQREATEMALNYVTLKYTGHTAAQKKRLANQVKEVVKARRDYERHCQIAQAKHVLKVS